MYNATLGCHGLRSPEIRLGARKRPLFMTKKSCKDWRMAESPDTSGSASSFFVFEVVDSSNLLNADRLILSAIGKLFSESFPICTMFAEKKSFAGPRHDHSCHQWQKGKGSALPERRRNRPAHQSPNRIPQMLPTSFLPSTKMPCRA